ncbi:helix-turn-helix transcriptional regulator [Amycolatopsis jiangsuensis]|uniref:DNA-binding CsgD family transcriptional regulator/anti-sigma regulatory factor (Ser/Thr protein kinase) n=1 Tax=Amycolatopsis jiangsuensis TaxID=1181879 RepID=A0A840IUI9_9PSEU|nr:LuxR C-terminal-related transcriptional regulator [Amycolatopsis jiangsuensis]MBB4685540.1 DNA-binding CsgD family transcriptional regulator/anti-sigma regulatory factor (Ser/Thr protein kinase) [Amycolatopsis jiangsuensis]
MDETWSDPNSMLDVVVRVMSVPRPRMLPQFSHELAVLLPHRAAVMQSGDCPRYPLKTVGDQAVTDAVTSSELNYLADQAIPGEAVVLDAAFGGAECRLVLLSSRPAIGKGAVLALVPEDPHPASDVLDLAVRLWHLTSLDAGQRASELEPDLIAGNLAAATARAEALTDLGQTHSATLVALLSVLRSGKLSDAVARQTATDLAARALVDLRVVTDRAQALSTESAREAFTVLADQLAPVVAHVEASIELAGPHDDRQMHQDIAHAARLVSRGLVLAALDRPGTTRVRVSWRIDKDALRVTVRDDGPEVPKNTIDPRLAERMAPLGGRWEVDSVPGWGTTVTATLVLDVAETPELHPLDRLNPRELEVLTGISGGQRNRQIAERLQLSEHTVKFHVRNLLEKLEVRSRGEAAALAHQLRLESVPSRRVG